MCIGGEYLVRITEVRQLDILYTSTLQQSEKVPDSVVCVDGIPLLLLDMF